MASSSTSGKKKSGFPSTLSSLAATFYGRGPDSSTREALGEARKAAEVLRKVIEVVERGEEGRRERVFAEAVGALRVLKDRIGRHGELVKKVQEGERRLEERLKELESGIVEANGRTMGYLSTGNAIKRDICMVKREIEMRKCEDGQMEESESESEEDAFRRPADKISIRTLASGDWDDSLDEHDEGEVELFHKVSMK